MGLRRFAPLAALLLLASCASTPRRDPAAEWAALESRFLGAAQVGVAAAVRTEGAVVAQLQGRMQLAPVDRASLAFSGRFAGAEVAPALEAGAGRMRYGAREPLREAEAGVELNRALLVGLLRMGITHNLAMLSSGSPPDHMDGGVDAWVTVGRLREGPVAGFDRVAGARPLSFDVYIDGKYAAEGALWLDARGLPVARHQVVQMGEREMRVVETYSDWNGVD